MTWIMPTYGRPRRLDGIFAAPGGMPDDLLVYLNEGDPKFAEYLTVCRRRGLRFEVMPLGSRVGDVYRHFAVRRPFEETFFGLVMDDNWPVTPGWWKTLEEAAGERHIAHSVDPSDPSPIPGAVCFGGRLVHAMGTLAPGGLMHNYVDNAWRKIGEDFGLLRPRPDVLVEHAHWTRGGAEKDATYERGSRDIEVDGARYQAWLVSAEREAIYERVGRALKLKPLLVSADLGKVRLAVCLPLGDGRIDVELDKSLTSSLEHCNRHGMTFAKYDLSGRSNIGYARELLMAAALRGDCTHVLMVDDDMAWDEPALLAGLLAADHDFAAVVGTRKTPGKLSFCCQFFEGTQPIHPLSGFLQVKTVGFGLVVIKRGVFERMIAAYPKLRYDAQGQEPAGHALFCETIIVDPVTGHRMRATEDVAFCHRWTGIGGEIYVDHQATLRHVGRFEYSGRIADVLEPAVPAKEAAE